MIACCYLLVGMKGVSVCCKSADLNDILLEGCNELLILLLICKKLSRVSMCLSGITARTDLNGVNAKTRKYLQGLLKRLCAVKISKYTQFHN